MRTLTIITARAAGGLLAACTPQEELHPTFGNAVHHNMSLHIINPAPTYSTLEQVPDFDGPRAAGAQQRYDDGEVIPPERLRTPDTGGSNSVLLRTTEPGREPWDRAGKSSACRTDEARGGTGWVS